MLIVALLLDAPAMASARRARPKKAGGSGVSPSSAASVDELTADLLAADGPPVRPCDPADPSGSGCDAEEQQFISKVWTALTLSHSSYCAPCACPYVGQSRN